MSFALGCEDVSLEYSSRRLFDHVTLGVDAGARIGIVGCNGDGKSSLLGILSGELEPDEGRIFKRNDYTIGILHQDDSLDDASTVAREIFGDVPEYVWASDVRIREILDHLIGSIGLDAQIEFLSGGERRRVDLARALVGTDDILMLDEPTNHLDMVTISWLASHLNRRWQHGQGVLFVVTHDRWFLDEVCNSMWEVHDGTVEPFEGGYSAYVLQRVERDEMAAKAEAKRRNLLRRELAWLSRGARARSTKPKFHVALAEELIAGEPPTRNTIELKRAATARLGKKAIDLIDVSKSMGGKLLLDDVSWIIAPGDRIGILGENGIGKTTLLKIIQGKIAPDSGRVNIGKTVKMSVLSQRLEELDEFGDYQVREVLTRYKQHYEIDGKEVSSAQLLERLGFTPAHFLLPVSHLSGGQKRRLQLMLTLLEGCNVLILDEPGNDMDIDMLSQMENILDTWPGTLIIVTHDRYLMEHVTDNQYAMVDGKVRHLPRGVDEYLEMTDADRAPKTDFSMSTSSDESDSEDAAVDESPQLSNSERQAMRKKFASTERKMETTSAKIEEATQRFKSADPTDYEELLRCEAEIDELKARLSDLESEWLELSDQLE